MPESGSCTQNAGPLDCASNAGKQQSPGRPFANITAGRLIISGGNASTQTASKLPGKSWMESHYAPNVGSSRQWLHTKSVSAANELGGMAKLEDMRKEEVLRMLKKHSGPEAGTTRKSGIKSKARVKDFGEVYTPPHIVSDMCELLPDEVWQPEKTFLEPSCGNGAFLAEILRRKLLRCRTPEEARTAVGSIYGIDILPDNVAESRDRMQRIAAALFPGLDVEEILRKNIMQGDSLHLDWSEAFGK